MGAILALAVQMLMLLAYKILRVLSTKMNLSFGSYGGASVELDTCDGPSPATSAGAIFKGAHNRPPL